MSKTNIKCPRCNSDKLYKFGMNKQAKQKYQCKQCKRQFAIGDGDGRPKLNNPKCPRCGKGTYLHHSYKHYNRYKCNNKKCNHIIVKHHTTNIDTASSELVSGSLSMKGMRFPLHVILTALTLYFLNNSSTRAISQFLMINSGIKVSHVTIASWTNKFAPFFKQKADKFKETLNLQSDDWHADETVVFINGERYYLWLAIDSETRFILAFHPSIYKIKNKNILIGIYYIVLCFLLLDPLYMSILSKFIGGGGDLNGIITGLKTSDIPFRIIFGIILIINILLFKNKVCPKYNRIFKEN